MALFKRTLKDREPPPLPRPASAPPVLMPVPAVERRSGQRFPVSPEFPLKAVLDYIGRDDTGAPLGHSKHGWHWKGRLLDCSESGARIQLGVGLRAVIGESCDLRLSVQDFALTVPCHITNIRALPEGAVFGLRHDIADEQTLGDYRQLVEVMALASTLRLRTRTPKPDESGYLVERYASARPSRLTVWRHPVDDSVSAFEFQLKDCLLRAAEEQSLEYFTGDDTGSRPATAVRCHEIHRMFQWVVPNLPDAVPADVKKFLRRFAA
jgi:hypothetical protein